MLEKILNFLEDLYQKVEILQKIVVVLKKIWKKIFYVLLLLFTFIILCRITYTRKILSNKYSKKIVDFIYKNSNNCLFVLLAILILTLFYIIWKNAKHDVDYTDKLKLIIGKLHSVFIHDIRDNVRQLDEYADDIRQGNNINYIRKQMQKNLSDNLQVYVDFLSEQLSKYCQDEISVCIKIVEFLEDKNKTARTIARSSNTKKKRAKIDESIIIKDNEDFNYLYNGENTFFASSNLVNEYTNGKYHVQDDISIWKKKYLSTLVVPIRYYSKHSRHNQVNLALDILGFLCIDSMNERPEWLSDESYELNLLAIFADELYIYIRKFKEIYSIKE